MIKTLFFAIASIVGATAAMFILAVMFWYLWTGINLTNDHINAMLTILVSVVFFMIIDGKSFSSRKSS